MADIQPKNTDTIRVNGIDEKTPGSKISLKKITLVDEIRELTGSAGVKLNQILNVLSTSLKPLAATLNLGTSTAAEHFLEAFLKEVTSNGQALTVGTDSAHNILVKLNGTTIWTFNQSTGGLESDATNGGNLTFGKGLTGIVQNGSATFTAAGTTQGTAAVILNQCTIITTCVAGVTDGVILPAITAATLFKEVTICNESGAAGKVYPATGANIDDAAANASFALADNAHKKFLPITTTRWLSF